MPVDMNALARVGARTRLAELVAEMDAILEAFPDLGKARARPTDSARPPGRRKMSEATKAKMRAAWARRKTESGAVEAIEPPTETPKKKRKMSAAGRAAIAAAQKKRWAAIKKSKN